MEDFNVFEEVARAFNADVDIVGFNEEKEITCIVCFNDKKQKIKTCVFTYDTEFYKEWLSNTIPKIISRQRNEGMQYIRFIALRSDTSDKLVKELKYQGLECTIKAFHVTYDKTTNRAVFVYSIICKLN